MIERSIPPVERGGSPRPRIPDGERVYAIGDVHGRLDLLEQLVGLVRQDSAARDAARVHLILIGDIVDRGPDSAELVGRCMAMADRSDRFIVLKGNHEAMMLHALAGNFLAFDLWLRNGGGAALSSWGVPDEAIASGPSRGLLRIARTAIPADVRNWLDQRPLTHRIGDYLFVHAGIRPEVALADQSQQDLLWIRNEFLESTADHSFVVDQGQSISDEGVVMQPNRIGIDTGAYRTGVLSALALEADRRWTLATDRPT